MARTALPVITPKGPYPGAVNAGDLAFVFTAADVANGNAFPSPGKYLVIAQNADAAGQTITITSVKDGLGRAGDVTAYNLPTTTFAAFILETLGWFQADGNFYVSASSANVKFAVIKLPY
jgi:hypothetical protein